MSPNFETTVGLRQLYTLSFNLHKGKVNEECENKNQEEQHSTEHGTTSYMHMMWQFLDMWQNVLLKIQKI